MSEIRSGGRNCGAVRFEARGTPKFIANCHCQACRRATGAPFSTWVGYESDDICWIGVRTNYESSPTVKRGFCAVCGTPLSYSGKEWSAETHLLIGTFDDPSGLVPIMDAFAEEKLPWVPLLGG
jgi:hypothetical protein